MNDADRNKRLAELLGICWCEPEYFNTDVDKCPKCDAIYSRGREFTYHPDFAADPRLVLRGMQQKGLFYEFVLWTLREYVSFKQIPFWLDYYILDTTGKLRDMAIEFLEVN